MLNITMPVLITVLLGFLCREYRVITPSESSAAKKIAMNITLPATSLSAYIGVHYSLENMAVPLWVFIALSLMLAAGFGIKKLTKSSNSLLPFLCTCFEGGMLGFPLYQLLDDDLSPFSLLIMANAFFIFTVYKILISGARNRRSILREALHSPPLWALFAGILLNVTGLYSAMDVWGIQEPFDRVLSFISGSTGFLILFSIGYDLDFRKIQLKKSLAVCGIRLALCAVMLGLTLLVNRFVLHGLIRTDAAVLMFMLPAPYAVSVFADNSPDRDVIASSLSIMTCLTLIFFCIMSAVK